jgi:Family of unknown function (DUF6152)
MTAPDFSKTPGTAGAVAALVAQLIFAVPVLAHHSGAMFDRGKTVTLVGTILEYQFKNPHVWIEVMVPDKTGKQVQWSIEGEGPGLMARIGMGPKAFKKGDRVTLHAHPLRDGRSGGSFIDIKMPDGKVIGSSFRPPRAAP